MDGWVLFNQPINLFLLFRAQKQQVLTCSLGVHVMTRDTTPPRPIICLFNEEGARIKHDLLYCRKALDRQEDVSNATVVGTDTCLSGG